MNSGSQDSMNEVKQSREVETRLQDILIYLPDYIIFARNIYYERFY
jgi:hypothetical protein